MVDVCVLASMWYAQKNIYGRWLFDLWINLIKFYIYHILATRAIWNNL